MRVRWNSTTSNRRTAEGGSASHQVVRGGGRGIVDQPADRLRVLAVGALAEQNLLSLGHLNIKANGGTEAPLPGDVCVEAGQLSVPRPGSRLRIEGP